LGALWLRLHALSQRGKTINQADLRDTLIALARDGKMHTEMLWKIMDEVHALRATVPDLDPTFDEVLKRKRKERANPAKLAAVIAIYDDITAELRAGSVC